MGSRNGSSKFKPSHVIVLRTPFRYVVSGRSICSVQVNSLIRTGSLWEPTKNWNDGAGSESWTVWRCVVGRA